jgi:hypothetical protein
MSRLDVDCVDPILNHFEVTKGYFSEIAWPRNSFETLSSALFEPDGRDSTCGWSNSTLTGTDRRTLKLLWATKKNIWRHYWNGCIHWPINHNSIRHEHEETLQNTSLLKAVKTQYEKIAIQVKISEIHYFFFFIFSILLWELQSGILNDNCKIIEVKWKLEVLDSWVYRLNQFSAMGINTRLVMLIQF